MPFRSEKQRRFLWAAHPDIAKRWAKKYPESNKNLPMYADNKSDKDTSNSKAAAVQLLRSALVNNSDLHMGASLLPLCANYLKRANSKLEHIEMPHDEKPTYAGEKEINSILKPDTEDEGSIGQEKSVQSPEKAVPTCSNPLLSKLAVVLSPKLQQELENIKAEEEARKAQRIPDNVNVKQYPVANNMVPPPMGMTAPPPTTPAPQAPAPEQLAAVGGGNSPNANPINSFGGLSTDGDINGNAAFGTQNSMGGEKLAKDEILGNIMSIEVIDPTEQMELDEIWLDNLRAKAASALKQQKCSCGCGQKVHECTCPKSCSCRQKGGSCYGLEVKEAGSKPGLWVQRLLAAQKQKQLNAQLQLLAKNEGGQSGVLMPGDAPLIDIGGKKVPLTLVNFRNGVEMMLPGDINPAVLAASDNIALKGKTPLLSPRGKNRQIGWLSADDAQEEKAAALGLWDRIRAKKKRGEKPAKPGDKDYPDSKSWNKVTAISEKQSGTPAWQRSAGKNEEGGLNEKGRKSYEREHGGNLKAPVTESNPSGERAKRQNSFCSRMCGMKRVNTGASTAKDPDSRINKSLRKWNCKCSSAFIFGDKVAQEFDPALSRDAENAVMHGTGLVGSGVIGSLAGLPVSAGLEHVVTQNNLMPDRSNSPWKHFAVQALLRTPIVAGGMLGTRLYDNYILRPHMRRESRQKEEDLKKQILANQELAKNVLAKKANEASLGRVLGTAAASVGGGLALGSYPGWRLQRASENAGNHDFVSFVAGKAPIAVSGALSAALFNHLYDKYEDKKPVKKKKPEPETALKYVQYLVH